MHATPMHMCSSQGKTKMHSVSTGGECQSSPKESFPGPIQIDGQERGRTHCSHESRTLEDYAKIRERS